MTPEMKMFGNGKHSLSQFNSLDSSLKLGARKLVSRNLRTPQYLEEEKEVREFSKANSSQK
jgi:hypothetical protein